MTDAACGIDGSQSEDRDCSSSHEMRFVLLSAPNNLSAAPSHVSYGELVIPNSRTSKKAKVVMLLIVQMAVVPELS